MKKNLKYFENELNRINKEFAEYKKQHMKKPEIGKAVEIAGMEWMILDKTEKGYFAVLNGFDGKERVFDSDSNNWISSKLREELNTKFLKKIVDELGEDAVIEFDRDLLSLDGQTEYGHCKDKISLLTVDEYRKYRKLLPNMPKWWWLITPWSTPVNDYNSTLAVVAPSGDFISGGYGSSLVVRPVCIFSSSIFELESDD
ncbi:hypothetical protein DMI82_12390 [Blautia sp. BCRC 81119]|uniref:hypothetical protein n=1 Tax=Blautia sp. BCRC 81119 TaxID=2212480 RepID=UPI000D72902D|nr:hypothetical protein [Blautia sp. BCRC 81119]PWY59014.1 hypothetical protein DMI82_12390 [Blautia sp. BCRC 81119]